MEEHSFHPKQKRDHRDKTHYRKTCSNPECRTTFYPNKDTAKFCSDACRQKVYRKRKERGVVQGGRMNHPYELSPYPAVIRRTLEWNEFQSLLPLILKRTRKNTKVSELISNTISALNAETEIHLDDQGSKLILRRLGIRMVDKEAFTYHNYFDTPEKDPKDHIGPGSKMEEPLKVLVEVHSFNPLLLTNWDKMLKLTGDELFNKRKARRIGK